MNRNQAHGGKAKHDQLVADGPIAIDGAHGRLTRDIVFTSPSAAGCIVMGRSCNGRDSWVSSVGTFGQRETRGVE